MAQFKFAELQYRLRALHVAEAETVRALELATTPWELAQARHQTQRHSPHDPRRHHQTHLGKISGYPRWCALHLF